MQPIQNFNGYDRPWAGGTGKNMAHVTIADGTATGVTTTNNGDGTVTFSGTPTSTAVRFVATGINLTAGVTYALSGRPQSADLSNDVWLGIYPLDSTSVISGTADRGEGRTYTPTEDMTVRLGARFPSETTLANVTFSPMLRLADTDPAFEPWENICPIYGHTAATAYRTGKNILRKRGAGTVEQSGLTLTTNDDGTILVNGTATAGVILAIRNHAQLINAGFGALAGQQFVLSGCPAGGSTNTYRIAWYNYDQPLTWNADTGNGSTGAMMDFESNPGMYLVIRIAAGTVCNNLLFKPMIRPVSDTDDTYSPYTGDSYDVSFGQTIYGGTLDFITGTLTKTWDYIASYNGETLPAEWISDRDVYAAGTTPTTGAAVAYKLATQQTIQVTPQEITTLLGTNNIWATTETNEP